MTNERPPMQHRTSSSGSLLTDRRMTFTAAISAGTRATATSPRVTLRVQAPYDAREALPNRRQIIRPLDVQITRTVTTGPSTVP